VFLGIQPNLVERTVFEAVRQDTALRPHYERQFADCYDHRECHRRDQAFADLHERWFNELGLRDLIAAVVNEFPHFRDQVSRLMVTQAPGPRAQTAELFGAPGQYTVVIAVAPATLLDRYAFQYWARHEFMHVDDMLDPAFGYDAKQRPNGGTAAAKNLMQDRYAVLWALSVDARLMHRGLAPADVRSKRRAELKRAFALNDAERAGYMFEEFWEQGRWFAPSHHRLLGWAQEGLPGNLHNETHTQNANELPHAGAPCALCGFPTFDWAGQESGLDELRAAICADFPNWTPRQPICGRCAEVYRTSGNAQAVLA